MAGNANSGRKANENVFRHAILEKLDALDPKATAREYTTLRAFFSNLQKAETFRLSVKSWIALMASQSSLQR